MAIFWPPPQKKNDMYNFLTSLEPRFKKSVIYFLFRCPVFQNGEFLKVYKHLWNIFRKVEIKTWFLEKRFFSEKKFVIFRIKKWTVWKLLKYALWRCNFSPLMFTSLLDEVIEKRDEFDWPLLLLRNTIKKRWSFKAFLKFLLKK